MSDIQHLLELLKSENPNKRYEACEELRVASYPLTQEAIEALNFAKNDANPEVADAAQRALAIHTPLVNPNFVDESRYVTPNTIIETRGSDIAFGFFGWFILGNLFLTIFFYFGPGLTVTLIWMSTIIAILLLLDKKRIWVMTGIISAFIINLIINTWLVYVNYRMQWEYPTSELIMLITSPFPGVWGFFLN